MHVMDIDTASPWPHVFFWQSSAEMHALVSSLASLHVVDTGSRGLPVHAFSRLSTLAAYNVKLNTLHTRCGLM